MIMAHSASIKVFVKHRLWSPEDCQSRPPPVCLFPLDNWTCGCSGIKFPSAATAAHSVYVKHNLTACRSNMSIENELNCPLDWLSPFFALPLNLIYQIQSIQHYILLHLVWVASGASILGGDYQNENRHALIFEMLRIAIGDQWMDIRVAGNLYSSANPCCRWSPLHSTICRDWSGLFVLQSCLPNQEIMTLCRGTGQCCWIIDKTCPTESAATNQHRKWWVADDLVTDMVSNMRFGQLSA